MDWEQLVEAVDIWLVMCSFLIDSDFLSKWILVEDWIFQDMQHLKLNIVIAFVESTCKPFTGWSYDLTPNKLLFARCWPRALRNWKAWFLVFQLVSSGKNLHFQTHICVCVCQRRIEYVFYLGYPLATRWRSWLQRYLVKNEQTLHVKSWGSGYTRSTSGQGVIWSWYITPNPHPQESNGTKAWGFSGQFGMPRCFFQCQLSDLDERRGNQASR